jgi:DNA repair protein SbcD/Mre11
MAEGERAARETAVSRKDALGDLQRMIEVAGGDADLQERVASEIGDLIRKLPHDVRADSNDAVLKAAIEGQSHRPGRRAAPSGRP